LKIIEGFEPARAVLSRQVPTDVYPEELEDAVRQIINEVRRNGDAALRDYTLKFDGLKITSLEVDKQQIASAYREVDSELVSALQGFSAPDAPSGACWYLCSRRYRFLSLNGADDGNTSVGGQGEGDYSGYAAKRGGDSAGTDAGRG